VSGMMVVEIIRPAHKPDLMYVQITLPDGSRMNTVQRREKNEE
jgi:hypothetical protein